MIAGAPPEKIVKILRPPNLSRKIGHTPTAAGWTPRAAPICRAVIAVNSIGTEFFPGHRVAVADETAGGYFGTDSFSQNPWLFVAAPEPDMNGVLAQITFEHPARLAWLAVIAVIWYYGLRSRANQANWRRWGSLALQTVTIVCLVGGLAGISRESAVRQKTVVVVHDVSRSVAGVEQDKAGRFIEEVRDRSAGSLVKVVTFPTATADRDESTEQPAEPAEPLAANDLAAADAASAITLAASQIGSGTAGKLVFLSDGLVDQQSVLKAAAAVSVPISTVPLDAFTGPEVCLRNIQAPRQVRRQGNMVLTPIVDSNRDGEVRVSVQHDGQTVVSQSFPVLSGENRLSIDVPSGSLPFSGDAIVFQVRVSEADDTFAENNVRHVAIPFTPPPYVLLVASQPQETEPITRSLRDGGCEVDIVQPADLPSSADALMARDLVMLANVPSTQLSAAQHDGLRTFVRDGGGGLIVLGEQEVFAPEVYRDSQLEALLPVRAIDVVEQENSILALVLVIDRSSSMEEQDRMKLAKVAAKQSVRLLKPEDKVGIIAFSNDTQWITELAPSGDKQQLMTQIDTLTPFGQTHMFPAVQRAFWALEQTLADRRHMIILTDGVPSPGDYTRLARDIAAAGITMSTVTISAGAEQDILRDMSSVAKGTHHHCEDPADLPQIIERDTREAVSDSAAREIETFALRSLPGLDVRTAPPLAAYAPTDPKPTSELLLIASGRDPLLSWQRYGAGITMAFTSRGAGTGAAAWEAWPGYSAFWQRVVQHAARPAGPDRLVVKTAFHDGRCQLSIEAADDRLQYVNHANVAVLVTSPDGNTETYGAQQVGPGRYETSHAARSFGSYEYDVGVQRHETDPLPLISHAVGFYDYDDELLLRPTNAEFLKTIAAGTGGQFDPQIDAIFADLDEPVRRKTPLWPALLTVAMAAFVAEVVVRKIR